MVCCGENLLATATLSQFGLVPAALQDQLLSLSVSKFRRASHHILSHYYTRYLNYQLLKRMPGLPI